MGGGAYVSPQHEYMNTSSFCSLFEWRQGKEALDLALHFFINN